MIAHVGAYSAYATLPSPGLLPPSPLAEQATARLRLVENHKLRMVNR